MEEMSRMNWVVLLLMLLLESFRRLRRTKYSFLG